MTRLAAALPKDATKNGLDAIASELLLDPLKRHLVLAVVDCSKITTDTGTGDCTATVRVLRIEQIHPDDVKEAERLIRRALEYRSGDTVLPIDLEKDLQSWFGDGVVVDMATGVVTVPADALVDPEADADPDYEILHEVNEDDGGDDDDDTTA